MDKSPRTSALSTLLFASLAGIAPATLSAFTVAVSPDTLQTMDGFGVSATWSGGEILRQPESERERVLRMFFTDEGAGLSIVRFRLVPKGDADFRHQADLGIWAKAKGVSRFYATVWNVPGTFLDGSQKLLPARFDDYAGHIADFIRDMAGEGISIGWIGVQNEPDNGPKLAGSWTVDYNRYTVHYYRTKAELRDFSVALKKVLAARGMGSVKLLGPECMGWEGSRELAKAQFETAEGRAALDVIATHDYWGAERDADMDPVRVEMAALAKTHGKRIWQTEYSRFDCVPGCADACQQPHVAQDPALIVSQAGLNMKDGLDMAQYLYRDLSKANASAWLYWWTHNPNKGCGNSSQGMVGMHNSFNGLAIIQGDNSFFFPKRFHVLSHYMRFIRPGSQRLKLETDGEAAIHPLAFRDPAGDKVVVVLYNTGSAPAPASLSLPGFPGHTSVKPFLTTQSPTVNVAAGQAAAFTAGSGYSLDLQPMSIVTLIFERPIPSPIHPRRGGNAGEARGFQGGVSYAAAAGETVGIEVRTLRGRLVFRSSRTHASPGFHRFTWPAQETGASMAQLTYSASGRVHRMLLLPPRP